MKPPKPEDFSSGAVRKKVLSEATQHPMTLFPAAASILSGLYMGLINFSEAAFTVAVGSGLLSLASWVYQYFIRGEKVAEDYVRDLKDRRVRYQQRQVVNIEYECRTAGFDEGEEAAKELKTAFERLDIFLQERAKERDSMTIQRFLVLARESYDQGVSFLTKGLALHRVLVEIDETKLKNELTDWEKEAEAFCEQLEKDGADKDHTKLLLKALEEKIRGNKRRLELYTERSKTLKQVMAQCEILEATLDTTYLEVVDLMDSEMNIPRESVAGNLERAVTAARRVEDKLRSLETGSAVDDSIYSQRTD
jgi:hypothetical protein